MENNIEILENIMRPYFEKKESIRKNKENETANLNVLKLRLEKLIDNKEREIQEYIDESMNSRSNFYSGYGAMIRKDLELAYKEREDALRNEIDKLERLSNFDRVDNKELINIKDELRPKLTQERKRLHLELSKQQDNFDILMLKLSNFKYEYNDQNQVINGDSWRKLYEESNEIADKIRDIRKAINQVDEYFKLIELSNEEIKIGMMSLTPWEQAEYNRRLEKNKKESIIEETPVVEEFVETKEETPKFDNLDEETIELPEAETIDIETLDKETFELPKAEVVNVGGLDEEVFELPEAEVVDIETLDEEVFELPKPTEQKEEFIDINEFVHTPYDNIRYIDNDTQKEYVDDMIIENDAIESNYAEIDGKMVVETYDDLLVSVYNEIMKEIEDIKSVRLNSSKSNDENYHVRVKDKNDSEYKHSGFIAAETLSGEYINEEDFNLALKNYYAKDKGRTFVVKENDKEFKISRGTIRRMKNQLKECTSLNLVKDGKLSAFDLYRVSGKERNTKDYNSDLGQINTRTENMDGDYINRNELIAKLDNVFKAKKTSWLKKVADKFRPKREYEEEDNYYDDSELIEYQKTK